MIFCILALTPTGLSPGVVLLNVFLIGFLNGIFPYVLHVYSVVLPRASFGSAMVL